MALIDTLTAKTRNMLKKTGDTMISGFLTLFQDPVDPLHAVTKQYVDGLTAGALVGSYGIGAHSVDRSDYGAAFPVDIYFPGVINGTTHATSGFSADILRAYPFIVSRTHTISDLYIVQGAGTGAGRETRFGVYNNYSATRFYPSTLVVDFGAFDLSSGGVKTLSGFSQVLQPGRYWLAQHNNNGSPVNSSMDPVGFIAMGSVSGSAPEVRTMLTVARTYSALPATYPTGSVTTRAIHPIVAFKVSA